MFNPNFITRLATTAFIGVSSIFGAVAPAEAYEVDFGCSHIAGYEACVSYQDRNNPDQIAVAGPRGKEYIEVSCFGDGGYKWNSYGPNSKQFNDYIASSFCR